MLFPGVRKRREGRIYLAVIRKAKILRRRKRNWRLLPSTFIKRRKS
jgi:hypothetical protein